MGGRGAYYVTVNKWKERREAWKNREYMKPEERPKESPYMQQKELKTLLASEQNANKRRYLEQSLKNYKTSLKKPKSATTEKQYKTSPEIEGLRRKAMAWHDEVVKRSWALTDSGTGLNAELRRVEEMAAFNGQTFDRKAYLRERKKIRRQAEAELAQVTKEYRALKEQIKRLGGKTSDL